jgi:adenylate cyclase class IV
MVEIEIKEKVRDFDTIRDNMSKLGVWFEDKGIKLIEDKKVLREKYGYKKFTIFLDEFENMEKSILIKKEANSETEQRRALAECKDLYNFLVAVSQA